MWTVLKIDKKSLALLKNNFIKELGHDVIFYIPKIKLNKFLNKKKYIKEISLLGDYLLCFHKSFSNKSVLNTLKYSKGLKYFLPDFLNSQIEIKQFISRCKANEDECGFLKSTFFDFKVGGKYQFMSGPFAGLIFNTFHENKLSIKAFMENYTVIVSKEKNLFRPIM